MSQKPALCGADVIAKLLNLTARRVQQLAADGVIPRAARGRYALDAAVPAYVRYLQERLNTRAVGQDAAVQDSDRRYHAARAAKEELRAEQLAGTLGVLATILDFCRRIFAQFRLDLEALAGRLADELARETEPARVRGILLGEVRRVLTAGVARLAELEQYPGTPADGDVDPDAAAPEGGG